MDTILVTGATGYLGTKLVERLLQQGKYVHALARDEGKLIALKSKHENVEIYPCPVESECLVRKAVKDCSGIFHLASLKHVTLAEKNALKAIETNIFGALTLLKATIENSGIRFIVASSSDKAETISGVYGASKFLVERLFAEFAQINGAHCKYRVVRFGNILHSTSSVVERWKHAIATGNDILLTEPAATRFFLTRDAAINAIFDCLENAPDTRPYSPGMKAVRLKDLLDIIIQKYGNRHNCNIVHIGLQEGESKHEKIDSHTSSEFAEKWDKDHIYSEL
jgi:UDP-N-acetylglucosamine 4,6-dehydratase